MIRCPGRMCAALLATTIAWLPPASAQLVREHEAGALRPFHGNAQPIRRSFQSDGEARAVLRQVLAAAGLAGLEDRIVLRASAETEGAVAFVEKDERLIFYNAEFMQEVAARTGRYWSMIAVIAHEVGHHVRFHTVLRGREHEFELEADYQAGFILRRMGATLAEAQSAFRMIGTENATPTHPARAERVQAVTLGWADGGQAPSGSGLAGQTIASAPAPQPLVAAGVTRLSLRGTFNGREERGEIVRTADRSWEWVDAQFKYFFVTISETARELVIYDQSRNIHHRFDLVAKVSYWRTGTAGAWNRHMDIVAVGR